ncbi:DUF4832 domain-containing protein [Butyrivibrio sp. MC2013]|uniref:DUF4832 domain-containing protein n=1 Tax=Butyrivibrio sp. MC2013 TaxID=1280686 RepID=UPI00041A9C70|nr:DUF4832 domain-containing protein [Butyrivibrio sp. MC2013]
MSDKRAGRYLVIILTIIILGASIVLWRFLTGTDVIHYNDSDEILINPYIGYVVCADDDRNIVDSSLVYIDITWAELEPYEGVYALDEIAKANHIAKWKEEGRHAVLRFVCDIPGKEPHRDMPDWLTGKISGTDYDMTYGRGYSPDYNDEVLIEYHAKAIKALGDYFGADDFVSYVELGSLGHWGEWHVYYPAGISRIPLIDIRRLYVEPYLEAFPHARLLMRRPFAELPEAAGVYNDMTGAEEDTLVFLDWIEHGGDYDQTGERSAILPRPEIWKKAPVGGEFTSSIPMSEMLGSKYERTLRLIEDSHMSFIGPKVPEVNEDDAAYANNAYDLLNHVGYRYAISHLSIAKHGKNRKVSVTVKNTASAPIYWERELCLYVTDAGGNIIEKYPLDVDLTHLCGGEETTCHTVLSEEYLTEDYELWVGIEDPQAELPDVYLAMDAPRNGYLSRLIPSP